MPFEISFQNITEHFQNVISLQLLWPYSQFRDEFWMHQRENENGYGSKSEFMNENRRMKFHFSRDFQGFTMSVRALDKIRASKHQVGYEELGIHGDLVIKVTVQGKRSLQLHWKPSCLQRRMSIHNLLLLQNGLHFPYLLCNCRAAHLPVIKIYSCYFCFLMHSFPLYFSFWVFCFVLGCLFFLRTGSNICYVLVECLPRWSWGSTAPAIEMMRTNGKGSSRRTDLFHKFRRELV